MILQLKEITITFIYFFTMLGYFAIYFGADNVKTRVWVK